MRKTCWICRDCADVRVMRSHFDGTQCTRLVEVYADSIIERPGRRTVEAQGIERER